MPRARSVLVGGGLVALVCLLPGCRLAPMSSSPLSGLMPGHRDRAVADQASKSSFPSPSDVGLAAEPSGGNKSR